MTSPDNDISLTPAQSLVYSILGSTRKAMTAYELLDQARSDAIKAPIQIYRVLEKLLKLRLIHRIESENAYIACNHISQKEVVSSPDKQAELFFICKDCGCVEEYSEPEVYKALSKIADKASFKAEHKILEIRGVCQSCQNSK